MFDITQPEGGPQCPPVPPERIYDWIRRSHTTLEQDLQDAADWGFTQALAAAQRLADEERQRVADDELEQCCAFIRNWFPRLADGTLPEDALRAARRPPAPTKREQAIKALRLLLYGENEPKLHRYIYEAMNLALQALEEAGDER